MWTRNTARKTLLSVAIASASLYGTAVAAQTSADADANGQLNSSGHVQAGNNQVSGQSDTRTGASISASAREGEIVDVVTEASNGTAEAGGAAVAETAVNARQTGEAGIGLGRDAGESADVSADARALVGNDGVVQADEESVSADIGAAGEGAVSAEVRPANAEAAVNGAADQSAESAAALQGTVSSAVDAGIDNGEEAVQGMKGAADAQASANAEAGLGLSENVSSRVQSQTETAIEQSSETATETVDTAVETGAEVAAEASAQADSAMQSARETSSEVSGNATAEVGAEVASSVSSAL